MREFATWLLFCFGCCMMASPPAGDWTFLVRGTGIAMLWAAIDVRYVRKPAKDEGGGD